eukprot:TRINITY_DN4246_c0_g1_i2.p1 TRINITY_DN4246_c0_g1~~TRINITY_DN4246_c0_g1_i2.p1  ORF type:complete len:392 (-),score=93.12 TRINITY_DN4246_c0_g1_i2:10-1185(-)
MAGLGNFAHLLGLRLSCCRANVLKPASHINHLSIKGALGRFPQNLRNFSEYPSDDILASVLTDIKSPYKNYNGNRARVIEYDEDDDPEAKLFPSRSSNEQKKPVFRGKYRYNYHITAPNVHVIDEEGNDLGVMDTNKARQLVANKRTYLRRRSASKGQRSESTPRENDDDENNEGDAETASVPKKASKFLDLVQTNDAKVPICRIGDRKRMIYDMEKKDREKKGIQHVVKMKEVRFSEVIAAHDALNKVDKIREFLEEGNRVRLTIMMTKASEDEDTNMKKCLKMVDNVVGKLDDLATAVEKGAPSMSGKVFMIELRNKKAAKVVVKPRELKVPVVEKKPPKPSRPLEVKHEPNVMAERPTPHVDEVTIDTIQDLTTKQKKLRIDTPPSKK